MTKTKTSGVRTVTKSTGIYRSTRTSSGPDPADIKAVLAAARRDLPLDVLVAARRDAEMKAVLAMAAKPLADAADLDGQLKRVEEHARWVLEAEPREIQVTVSVEPAGKKQGKVSIGDVERMKADAEILLFNLGQLRKALSNGDARGAAFWGLHVGSVAERLAVRPMEPLVRRERKAMAGREAGHIGRYGTDAEKAERWQAYKDAFDATYDKATMTKTTAYGKVAEQFGVKSFETVARAVRRFS
jgi:hypothetical protein